MSRYGARARRRSPLLLLALAVGAACSVLGCSTEAGIAALRSEDDRTLLAYAFTVSSDHGEPSLYLGSVFRSSDGGETWAETPRENAGEPPEDATRMDTPRGAYTIEGFDIWRLRNGVRELAYSTSYLRTESNRRLAHLMLRRTEDPRPHAIAYDARSGNVVVAMGTQGVVVESPRTGEWRRIAVDTYAPTDFSLIGKTLLLQDTRFGLLALTLAMSFTALGLALGGSARTLNASTQEPDALSSPSPVFRSLLIVGGAVLILLLPCLPPVRSWMPLWVIEAQVYAYPLLAVGGLATAAFIGLRSHGLVRRVAHNVLAFAATLFAVLVSLVSGSLAARPIFDDIMDLMIPVLWFALASALAASILAWPGIRRAPAALVSLTAIVALTALCFLGWIEIGVPPFAAHLLAVGFAVITALALRMYVMSNRPPAL